eukprot:Mycagemm_TRINITY_DN10368_c5_g1::TRINITY_DN10368_c5_g1_i1::g.707::m.707 type:complete len:160 gc:universal TRINITY_DN10368_c5_g1_i1:70-549(+)
MSHARKHVTNKILTENPVPLATERIVRVVEARGSNQYQVEFPNGQKVLCLRPSKFRNIVFIKRGDFLIILPEPDDPLDRSKIRSIINHVLFPDHIRNLKAQNLWPPEFDVGKYLEQPVQRVEEPEDDSDEDSLPANPNHRPAASDESEDESEEEEEDDD